MTLRVVCGVALNGPTVFLAKRGPGGPHAGLWEFPGGKVESGESDSHALERELREELGAEVRIGQQLAAVSDEHILLIALEVHFLNAPRAIEAQEIKWYTLEDTASLPMPPCDRKILQTLKDPQKRL